MAERILVVDDDQAGRYLKAHLLRRAGHDILEGGTGREALEMVANNDVSLVILDVKLPDMSGLKVCAEIKAKYPNVMVLQTSAAFTGKQERAAGLAGGADGYLVEPLEPDEFNATVDALLRRYRAERGLSDAVAEREAQLAQEMSHRVEAEDLLRHAQKLDVLGQLTGGIAHDFNNILTIIMGNLESMRRQLDRPNVEVERLRQHVDNAFQGSRRAIGVTRQLLAFSRRQPLAPAVIDLNTSVDGLNSLLRQVLGERINIVLRLEPEVWPVFVDAGQLETAVLNLVVNARDAMPEGGTLRVETINRRRIDGEAGDTVVLRVSDSGMGMSADVLKLAFEPFFTTKDVGHGTGLGLSQVYGFVTQSGGDVKIDSAPSQGCSVELHLPRYDGPLRPAVGTADSVIAAIEAKPGTKVLVVEDDQGVRSHTSGILREMGYVTREATTGKEALEVLAQDRSIAAVLTDVGLPGGMSGVELGRQTAKRFRDLPVIYTSAYARERLRNERLEDDALLVAKPFTYEALGAALSTALSRPEPSGEILVVEDEPMIRMELVDSLSEFGFRVREATSSGEALRTLAEEGANIVALVTDIGLPDGRGDDLARRARAQRADLPVIMTTGYGDAALRQSFAGQARTAFLAKPYRPEQVTDTLRRMGVH